MKITNASNIRPPLDVRKSAYVKTQSEQAQASGASASSGDGGRDTAEVSAEAKALQRAAAEPEPMRDDRIADLRRRLAEGQYKVSADDIARRLLSGQDREQ